MICPECGFKNQPGTLNCTNCNADLYDSLLGRAHTKHLTEYDTRDLESADDLPSHRPLVLFISDDTDPIAVERTSDVIIGRNEDDVVVRVDLGPYGGQDKGVSRQHVRLVASDRPPTVVDLDSYNGTFINGQRLIPQQSFSLKTGDELRLGRFVMRVFFK
jgi:pSer/pThr/pTyr-binding forkhead associated (FHA) protein